MTQTRSQYGLGKERTKEHVSAFESCQNQQFARSGLIREDVDGAQGVSLEQRGHPQNVFS